MRANSGSYIGFGGNSTNAGKSLTGNDPMMTRGNKIGYNDTIATPTPTPQSMTMRSRPVVVQHSTTLPANANAAALAAARQTLMGRLAAGGIGSFPPTTTPMGGNDQHYNHPQHHNHHHHNQQQQTKSLHSMHAPSFYASAVNSPSSSLHTPPTSIPPPPQPLSSSYTQHPLLATSFGPNAATATNAISPNAKATKVSNQQQQQQQQQTTNNKTNTTSSTITSNSSNVINTNSTPKPFYNASSSQPLWKSKF